jgi:hypothetical protein
MLTPILQVKESAPPYGDVETGVVDPNPDADPDSNYHPRADRDADPDSDFLFDADPDPTCHHADPDLDPDPSYQLKAQTFEIGSYLTPIQTPILPQVIHKSENQYSP